MLKLANTEIVMTRKELHSTQAFYAAEAGMAQLTTKLYNEEFEDIADTVLGEANYQVDLNMDELLLGHVGEGHCYCECH